MQEKRQACPERGSMSVRASMFDRTPKQFFPSGMFVVRRENVGLGRCSPEELDELLDTQGMSDLFAK